MAKRVWDGWLVKDLIEARLDGRALVRLENGRVYVVDASRFWDEDRGVCA